MITLLVAGISAAHFIILIPHPRANLQPSGPTQSTEAKTPKAPLPDPVNPTPRYIAEHASHYNIFEVHHAVNEIKAGRGDQP
ncbi:MAG TPA: hypothetical protein VGN15_13995 [Ktedonobacteraceae bacterium]|jgi:hypothetical protein|nr:hypothetical protein [Ktedonobacteraceae bacterium]